MQQNVLLGELGKQKGETLIGIMWIDKQEDSERGLPKKKRYVWRA